MKKLAAALILLFFIIPAAFAAQQITLTIAETPTGVVTVTVPGPAGVDGKPGPAQYIPRGVWSPFANYSTNHQVNYGGSSFVAVAPNANVTPSEGAIWTLIAAKGDQGPAGPLNIASPSTLGGIKVGSGLAITADGTLNNTGIAGVASFAGRGGAVTPAPGDYSINQITGAAAVAATGSYNDLTNKPVIPAAQVSSDWNAASGVAQILNKPTIPTALSQLTQSAGFRTVTDTEKATWNSNSSPVQSVFGRTGAIVKQAGDYTATDVGADPLGSATSVQTNLNTHTARTDNPHSVTKAQLGLGSVDNTSDAAKPVSTAVQSALDLKANANALPANTSAVNHYFLTGYNSSTKAFSMAQPTFADLLSPPTTLAGYGISDAYTRAFLDSALAGKLSDAPSDGNSYARKNGAWSPFVGGVQPFANISAALRANGITTPSVTSAAPDGTHGVWMKNTVPYTGARTGGAIFHNMTTMNYCETDNNCKRFGSGNSSGGITALTGDVTASGTGSVAATLANSGATAGTYTNATVTVNAKGLVTSASSGATPIGGTVGSTADHFPVSSGTGGSTLKASGAWIDPVTGMLHTPEQSGVREVLGMGDGSLAHWAGWTLAGTLTGDYYLALPTSAPSAGQTLVTGTPATVTVDGVASTVIPVTFTSSTATSGFYTPTVTAGTNTSALTSYKAHWMRVDNEVSVWGQVDATANSGGSTASLYLTLPPGATSTFTAVQDLEGHAAGYPNPHSGIMQADTSTGKALLMWIDSTSGSITWKYSYTYTVK